MKLAWFSQLLRLTLCSGVAMLAAPVLAAELVVAVGSEEPERYSSEALLARADVVQVQLPGDPAYAQPMSYQAVPLAALLAGVPSDATVQVTALDGFVAELPAEPLLQSHAAGARAMLAIENPDQPWPALGPERGSAGPFYVVWVQPEAGDIRPEQWPYQVAEIRVTSSLAERFPAMLPHQNANELVQTGWQQFQTHCVVCHTVNGQGSARKGPDLNLPHNPTEYFAAGFLKQYIRNPASLSRWPQRQMPAFPPSVLSDHELEALLAYLAHMAERKIP